MSPSNNGQSVPSGGPVQSSPTARDASAEGMLSDDPTDLLLPGIVHRDGFTLLPIFAGHEAGSEWNDLAQVQGRDAAHQQFTTAVAIAEREHVFRRANLTP